MSVSRGTSIVPRLLVVLLLVGCTSWGIDPLLKWALLTSGPSWVGAPLEVASLKTSLQAGTLQLQGLTLHNPNQEDIPLLQATDAELAMDLQGLCQRRLVIRQGLLSGIKISPPPHTQQIHHGQEPSAQGQTVPPVTSWLAHAGHWAAHWLHDLDTRYATHLAEQFQTPQVVQQIQARWSAAHAVLQDRLQELHARGEALAEALDAVSSNPLRHQHTLQALRYKLATKQEELATVEQQLTSLIEQQTADQRAMEEARLADRALLDQAIPWGELDEDQLTQIVLGTPATTCLASSLAWIGWARHQLHATQQDLEGTTSRGGTTVSFGPRQPRYLIERLQLEGRTHWGGYPLTLTGELQNASSAPHLHDQPLRLTLRGTGSAHVALEMTLDHRGETPHETLQVACPQLSLPGFTADPTDQLALEILPSRISLETYLEVWEDQVSGEIHLAQNSLELRAAPAKQPVPEMPQAHLAPWQARLLLSGTLDKPELAMDSDLGQQMVVSLKSLAKTLLAARGQQLLADAQSASNARWQQLVTTRQAAQQKLLAQLDASQQLVADLITRSDRSSSNTPNTRLSRSLRLRTQQK